MNFHLWSFEEVNWNSKLIKNEKLPSILECMRSVEKPYVEQGLDRYIQSNINNLYSNLENVYILPIKSDPLSVDGDDIFCRWCTFATL